MDTPTAFQAYAMLVECPRCCAEVGQPCITYKSTVPADACRVHLSRVVKADWKAPTLAGGVS